MRNLKIVFPAYQEGNDAEQWLQDCEEYFKIYEIEGPNSRYAPKKSPKYWYKPYISGKEKLTRNQFSTDFIIKFNKSRAQNVFDQFKLLKQTTMNNYYDEFKDTKGKLHDKAPSLPEEFFVGSMVLKLSLTPRLVVE